MTPYDRLKELGLELPTPAVPMANYVPFVLVNGFLYLSGQGPEARRRQPAHRQGRRRGECRGCLHCTRSSPV
jgi:enamine deaminase RidA (YjgF/YER057c/UK114 family)